MNERNTYLKGLFDNGIILRIEEGIGPRRSTPRSVSLRGDKAQGGRRHGCTLLHVAQGARESKLGGAKPKQQQQRDREINHLVDVRIKDRHHPIRTRIREPKKGEKGGRRQ